MSQKKIGSLAEFAGALWKDGVGLLLVSVAFGWFLVLGVRLVFPALLPHFRADFSLTHTTGGLVITLLWLSYALTQFPGGVLGDRYGEKRVLAFSSLLGTLSILAVSLSPTVWIFVLATILYGLGSGMYSTPRVTIITKAYTDREGTALGIVYASGNLGSTILPAVSGLLAVYVGWRLGFAVLAPIFFLLLVLTLFVSRRVNVSGGDGSSAPSTGRRFYIETVQSVVRDPVLSIAAIMFFSSFAYQGLIGFYPTYLIEVRGIAPETASVTYAAFFGVGIAAQFSVGRLSDATGKPDAMLLTTGVNVVGLVLLTQVENIYGIVLVTLFLSISLGIWPVSSAYAVAAVPPEIEGSSFGLVRTLFLAFAAVSPVIVGVLFDFDLANVAFFVLAVAAAVAFALALHLRTNHDIR